MLHCTRTDSSIHIYDWKSISRFYAVVNRQVSCLENYQQFSCGLKDVTHFPSISKSILVPPQ